MVIAGVIVVRWIVRRSLAPLDSIIDAARQASKTNLRTRVPVGRGRDEVTDLALTFNIMLAGLDDAFEAQRRFAANASHELQTPLAATQAVLDDALADLPQGTSRQLLQDLRSLNSRSVQTVRTLLDLAEAQAGQGHWEEVNVTRIIDQEIGNHRTAAMECDVTSSTVLDVAFMQADPTRRLKSIRPPR